MVDLSKITGFEWDDGNILKNWEKHQVSQEESEQVFNNLPRKIRRDKKHSQHEERFMLLGVTDQGRELIVFFTIRNNRIRVISARDQNRGRESRRFRQP